MVTDVGICWAINSDHMRNIYKSSPGIETFLESMGHEGEESAVIDTPGVGTNHSFRLNLAMRGEECDNSSRAINHSVIVIQFKIQELL